MKNIAASPSASAVRRRHRAFFDQFGSFLEDYVNYLGKASCAEEGPRCEAGHAPRQSGAKARK